MGGLARQSARAPACLGGVALPSTAAGWLEQVWAGLRGEASAQRPVWVAPCCRRRPQAGRGRSGGPARQDVRATARLGGVALPLARRGPPRQALRAKRERVTARGGHGRGVAPWRRALCGLSCGSQPWGAAGGGWPGAFPQRSIAGWVLSVALRFAQSTQRASLQRLRSVLFQGSLVVDTVMHSTASPQHSRRCPFAVAVPGERP